ncbi:MAG: hypothetical protein LBM93_14900 [Oscillospiraceae bacterium]|jgi:hypothetical protein|nr:hypothetical protein [Oscillospiraceae bacterium]
MHAEFISRVSINAMINYHIDYQSAIKLIKSNPTGKPKFLSEKLPDRDLRYCLFYKRRYKIVFEIKDNAIFIYDIIDCRQSSKRNQV